MATAELRSAVDHLLGRECPSSVVRAAEAGEFPQRLWDLLAMAGVPWIGTPEADGGSGGSPTELAEVLRLCGRHAVPLPVAETGMLASWLLAAAGVRLPTHPITVAVPMPADQVRLERSSDGWVLNCSLANVPWGGQCAEIVFLSTGGHVVRLPVPAADVTPHVNLAGEPRDAVRATAVTLHPESVSSPVSVTADEFLQRGSLSRTLLTAGAVSRVRELTFRYAKEREQFGRPIARFQAVQQLIAVLAAESELAMVSAVAAVQCYERADHLGVAAARVAVNRAAIAAHRAAHQVHGAIGMTHEYDLQIYSRRIMAWRHEYGTNSYWARRVGQAAADADDLWPAIADGH